MNGLWALNYGTVSQTNTYTYDALDRLLTVSDGTAANDEMYQYDPLDNLTQQSVGTPATATYQNWRPGSESNSI